MHIGPVLTGRPMPLDAAVSNSREHVRISTLLGYAVRVLAHNQRAPTCLRGSELCAP
jgi:hypothetical protein